MMKKIIATSLMALSMQAVADKGWIATDVEVTAVTNTNSNGQSFSVVVTDGDGNYPCEDTTIGFPLGAAGKEGGDEGIHNRAFSLAITALTAGKRVSIYSYSDNSICSGAAHIKLLK
ncbi:DUF5992 family protein [Microbulbifer sp. JTAC008]|uniref:DUF5992 family protein n=1 Tax=Microbulbifer sp. JTAC008 TaxID=3243374 RepID=UPI004039D477